jgi:hypothetical protein
MFLKSLSRPAALLPPSTTLTLPNPCDLYSSVYGCHLQRFLTILRTKAAKKENQIADTEEIQP